MEEQVKYELKLGVQNCCLRDIKRGPLEEMDSVNRTVMLSANNNRGSLSHASLPRALPGGCGLNVARAAAWLLPTSDFTRNVEIHGFVGQDGDESGKVDDVAKTMKDHLQIEGRWVQANFSTIKGKKTAQCVIVGDEFSGRTKQIQFVFKIFRCIMIFV